VGLRVSVPVIAKDGFCVAVKERSDHQFDITAGLEIVAQAHLSEKIELVAGKGVGRIMAKGLCQELGKPAISSSARRQIMSAIEEGMRQTCLAGTRVELSVPRGLDLGREDPQPQPGSHRRHLHPGLDWLRGALERPPHRGPCRGTESGEEGGGQHGKDRPQVQSHSVS